MVNLPPLLRRRLLCTQATKNHHHQNRHHNHRQWSIKQVTKSNFSNSVEEIKSHISSSDFIAVSLENTGSFSAPWHRVSAFDTLDTAYLKAKYAAERFQILQFAVCPFTVRASKVTAFPYNFHLFPRDELKLGMPSYAFSCQTSHLTSMAREGFDFNTCIYDGISYLSRAQESVAKVRLGSPLLVNDMEEDDSTQTVADKIFIERIMSRVKHWKKACNDSNKTTDEALVGTLRKIVLGNEMYGSRPCINIDVCSERQVKIIVKMLQEHSDDLIPLIIPTKSGGTQAIRIVLTSSEEDRDLLQRELQSQEDEQNKKVRGFREVIDLISTSQKPVISYNSLNDLTFIHSKLLSPLPPSMDEFISSLRSTFRWVIDVNHLMKEITPLRKVTNIPEAISFVKNRFFVPVDMEIPSQVVSPMGPLVTRHGILLKKEPDWCLVWVVAVSENEAKFHGHNVVRICELFSKLCYILKMVPNVVQFDDENMISALEAYANIFNPFSSGPKESIDGEIRVWSKNTRKVNCEDMIFLWGFSSSMTAGMLKSLLQESHEVFSKEFDVRLVERGCAILVFWQPSLSKTFIDVMNSSEICGPLRELVSDGLMSASYEIYDRACRLGLWEANLIDSLDRALRVSDCPLEADCQTKSSETYWSSELIINLDEL